MDHKYQKVRGKEVNKIREQQYFCTTQWRIANNLIFVVANIIVANNVIIVIDGGNANHTSAPTDTECPICRGLNWETSGEEWGGVSVPASVSKCLRCRGRAIGTIDAKKVGIKGNREREPLSQNREREPLLQNRERERASFVKQRERAPFAKHTQRETLS